MPPSGDGSFVVTDVAAEDSSSTERWDRDAARRALDDLFTNARQFNSSSSYFELMQFIGQFRFYSPFNAMLIHIQMPGARFVATARRWDKDFGRQIKIGAHPLVILQPMGPVLFVFDVIDTEPLPGARPLPSWVEYPFEVRRGQIGTELDQTVENAKRDGVQGRPTRTWITARRLDSGGTYRRPYGFSDHGEANGQIPPPASLLRAIAEQQSIGGSPVCNLGA